MDASSLLRGVVGGGLIGLAATVALLSHGRVAGVCGILGRVLDPDGGRPFRVPFLVALVAVGLLASLVAPSAFGAAIHDRPTLALAGLLVGVGTTVGNGCTSGHGVCGISRGSRRSLVATVTFMTTGIVTVALVGAHA